MTRKYRKFSDEFKREAVRLSEESDKPVTEVARELDIRVNQIYKWKKQLSIHGDEAFPGKGKQTRSDAEVTALRKEVERLRMENEILKKAAAYFAKEVQ